MEKDHLSIKKVVRIYEINQRLKLWACVPIAILLQLICIGELLEIRNIQ